MEEWGQVNLKLDEFLKSHKISRSSLSRNGQIHYKQLIKYCNNDMKKVSKCYPQGELILISECGKYDDFILKCMERLCTHAQLEIMLQTKLTLDEYREYLKDSNKELYKDICKYSKGARCTFPNYKCMEKCYFKEGVLLTRDI